MKSFINSFYTDLFGENYSNNIKIFNTKTIYTRIVVLILYCNCNSIKINIEFLIKTIQKNNYSRGTVTSSLNFLISKKIINKYKDINNKKEFLLQASEEFKKDFTEWGTLYLNIKKIL